MAATTDNGPAVKATKCEDGEQKDSGKSFCKKLVRFLLTKGALLVANILVLIIGGFLFTHLESFNEIESCKEARTEYQGALQSVTELVKLKAEKLQGMEMITDEAKKKLASEYGDYLKTFAKAVKKTGHNKYHICENLGSNATWTFSNSLVFSLTVITTIGYGVVSPSTTYGRLVCIAYAVLSIPIYVLALASIGDVLAKLFKKVYWLACCCGCCRKRESQFTDVAVVNSGRDLTDKSSDDNGQGSAGDPFDSDNATIPLTITISVLLLSVIVGGIVFAATEEWDFLHAFYYSFISISTIGFGDVVPNIDLSDSHGLGKLIAVIVYVTVGMASVSMCFQLMADEMVAKFTWVADKCGVKRGTSEDDDDDDESLDGSRVTPRAPTLMRGGTQIRMSQFSNRSKTPRASPAVTKRMSALKNSHV